jgi:hypothetical protein
VQTAGTALSYPNIDVTGGQGTAARQISDAADAHIAALIAAFTAKVAQQRSGRWTGLYDEIRATQFRRTSYLPVRFDESSFVGGAHDNHSTTALIFDVAEPPRRPAQLPGHLLPLTRATATDR